VPATGRARRFRIQLLELVVLAIEAGSEGQSAGVSPILLGDQARFKTKAKFKAKFKTKEEGKGKTEKEEEKGKTDTGEGVTRKRT